MAAPAASCINTEHGCVMFDCLVHLWEWLDPPVTQSQYQMENKKPATATQQPISQQHLMAHHVHPDQIYSPQPPLQTHVTAAQPGAIQPNGVMHHLLQSQYHSNTNARSPLLENRHELYGTGHNHEGYARLYGANDNYNYPQSPPRQERTDLYMDHNVNHELLHNMPKGYNAEVYQDYLKRNPPKDTNQIYQNHQPIYRPNMNTQQYSSKPYLPYSNRIGPQSNTELLRRQYNEIQQMKLQQQMHYQNQAQMQQQQKFAERQLLLQQIHGVQPPPNLQNSIYSDGSYRDLDRYSSKNDFKEYSSADIQKDVDRYAKNNEYKEIEKQTRQNQEAQWQSNQQIDIREIERYRKQSEGDKSKSQSPPELNNQSPRNNVGVVSPMKSSDSSSPSVKSPSESRRSSSGNQALRSPIAQRIPSAPVTLNSILYKQGSDGLKVWRKRWFVLSEYCLFYYKSQDEEKLLGSVLLPSYRVSACTAEDKVMRKFAFKLEHVNMRTYVLAALDQEAMMKWVRALTMAALMQSPNDQSQKQSERAAAKTEDGDEVPGPTYANAPPKPRRSNEGYNSPSPDMYDPNYDLLKKPASHYSQGTNHMRYQDHTNYQISPNQESIYTRSPQSPPAQQPQYQTKRPYDTHHLSLPLTNTVTDRLENNQPSISNIYRSNPQSPYFDNRNRSQQQQQAPAENQQEQIYERQAQRNPFLQDLTPPSDSSPKESELQINRATLEQERMKAHYNETYPESRTNSKSNVENPYNRDVYGELNARPSRTGSLVNERLLIERRTPDAYGRSTTMSGYNKGKVGDYEDVYAPYATENEYGITYAQSPPQTRDAISVSSQQHTQEFIGNYPQEKTFSGPSVLRRKKMQSSGIQPPMPRPHSADFLEYESKNENLNKTMPQRTVHDQPKQPQRPKSSLDINSYYDPSSDRYYSEESYAEKMRQSAQYLQQGMGSKGNIQIPLAKYASGLAEKQLHSPYSQITNNNYETEFCLKNASRDNASYNSKYSDLELSSNWTLKEKENHKDYLNRSGSVMSDSSNAAGFAKDLSRYDPAADGFMRSASARLPSNAPEKDGEKKVQQREESMKRLLEWKQRMLQSPLTRKSTPATISLARSLNQSRQSVRSDQYRPKTYTNASYNSYSSDDEEDSPGTDLQKPRDMQAGRSIRAKLTSPIHSRPVSPHAPAPSPLQESELSKSEIIETKRAENTYENVLCTISMPSLKCEQEENTYEITHLVEENLTSIENTKEESNHDGYETNDSEAESETQLEYTDNDLDEVLMDAETDNEVQEKVEVEKQSDQQFKNIDRHENSETPPAVSSGEDHYLPMSPRKVSTIEPAHKTILENLSVFDQTMAMGYEDNPYVEMNLGNEDEDMQTYEIVCVNNGKVEPVYMELSNVSPKENNPEEITSKNIFLLDTASNFANTKDHTLKRASKCDRELKEKLYSSDADDEASKDLSLDVPFSRFSISDTFRPASYYLGSSNKNVDILDSSDSEILPPPPIPTSSPPCDELSDEALSKYVLDKLDKSDMSQDNSILKMLTSENQNQKMNTVKRKTTSLMIYGSRTSIHDTLSRGEKIRNSRASLTNDRKLTETSCNLLGNSILEQYNSSSVESDSLRSYNADRGSSRLSLESDISSKFEMAPSNMSSEVTSLNDSEQAIDLRYPSGYRDIENMMKRRPLSDDSIFELANSDISIHNDIPMNGDLDMYLDNLQPSTSDSYTNRQNTHLNTSDVQMSQNKDTNMLREGHLQSTNHMRCFSSPVTHTNQMNSSAICAQYRNINEQINNIALQSSSSSAGITKSPISYYCKNYDEEKILSKNLNSEILADKIKEFESDKLALKTGNDTNASSTSTGFHSRESSTEHSAPYYYSDLSSQEHINLLPTSHYLKNTNLHRKLNNQRRRGPLHKKNEISHIQNPIHNNQILMSDRPFDLAASARSVSVEFLSAADKDPEIDIKNIYESTGIRNSKIPESMNLISGLGCKRNSTNNSTIENSSPESNPSHGSGGLNASSSVKVSNASMSSHCSGNSSNTVYYDAEAETSAYENVISQGEKHWDEDSLWRDNLRRVSHRHARSMDDLDAVPPETPHSSRPNFDICGMNSIKRVKKNVTKICRNVTYVNCDIQNQVLRLRDSSLLSKYSKSEEKIDDNDVYVSLAENTEKSIEQSDEGVYEQLAVDSLDNSVIMQSLESNKCTIQCRNKRRFEIDREKLRQWDLLSSGLMKGGAGRVRGAGLGAGMGNVVGSTDTGTDSARNEASMTMTGTHVELSTNISNQQTLSKKAFLGSNTSIGRNNRDANIPVRAVSPRVRWVEEKPQNDHYGSQQMSISQQNLHALTNEDSWTTVRSPSRAQQPIRAVSPRVRRSTETDDLQRDQQSGQGQADHLGEIPTAGELLGRTHEELVLLLIQLRRRHAATHRAIEQCCTHISSIEDCLGSLKAMEREESLQRLEQLKMQLIELEHQYEKSKPLVQLVDNMVKLGSLYNRPGSTVERLERNQRLRQKVLAEHAFEQQRWLESAAAGKPLETEAARARVAELWALEQELADEAAILQGLKTDKDAIESLLTGVRSKLDSVPRGSVSDVQVASAMGAPNGGLEAELARVHAMLAHNSKKLEQTVADNARLERELQQLRRALQARRAAPHAAHPTALLEDEVTRVQQLVTALQRQRQELSRAVRHLTQQSHALQSTHDAMPGKQRRPMSSWQETNLDTGMTIDHGHSDYYEMAGQLLPPGHYPPNVETPLYVDTRASAQDITSPITSEDLQHSGFANLSNVEKQEIKTVRIVKRESERRQRDRERSLQPMSDWPSNNLTANLDQFLEEELVQSNYSRASSLPRHDFSKFEEYYSKPQAPEPPNYLRLNDKNMELSPKYPSSPSLSNYDYSRDISSMSSSYNKSYDRSGYDRTISISTQYLNSPTDSAKTLTNDPMSKTSSVVSLTRSHMELSPIFKSEAAKQIITEMSGDGPKTASLHRRQVPKEKRRHNTAPHHLSAKTLNEMPKDAYNQDKMGRSLDDADMERALRAAPAPDVVRSALPTRYADSIDQLLAAPQKILIPERYIPEKPPELSPEEQQKRLEKVESIKKMLSGSSADPSKSPDGEEKRQREHLLQMNQILAKQVTEMSKIIAVKALEELPRHENGDDLDDRSPDVELPIYQQRDNFFT